MHRLNLLALAVGLFGVGIDFLGGSVFAAQKGFWSVIRLLYLTLGVGVILSVGSARGSLDTSPGEGCSPNAKTVLWDRGCCSASPSPHAPTR